MKSLYFRSNQLAINGLCCRRFLSLRSLLTRIATPLLNSSSKLKANQNEDQPTTLQDVKSLEPEKRRLQKFIPVTRRILFHKLLEEKRLLNSSEKRLMNNVAAALDAKFSQKFYRILEESKLLYDGMDPDKDTIEARELSRKEVLDNEYLLLQKVEKMLDKANFFEIPRMKLLSLLRDINTNGVIIHVDPSQYELLRFWTKGYEVERYSPLTRFKGFVSSLLRPRDSEVLMPMTYTRVFLAVRPKGEKKLHLKVFKEIHTNQLEHLLPKGKIKMSKLDRSFLASSVFLGACIPFMRVLPTLSDLKLQWIWGGVGLAGLIASRAWIGYKNKRNYYLASLVSTLYFKIVANNRGVLTLLADRAQDEEFKEAILAYTFLLSPQKDESSKIPIYDSPESLKSRIEMWLQKHFQLKDFSFDIEDALNKLDDLGLLVTRRNGTLTVVSMEDALRILPESSLTWWALGAKRDSESLDEQLRTDSKKSLAVGWS